MCQKALKKKVKEIRLLHGQMGAYLLLSKGLKDAAPHATPHAVGTHMALDPGRYKAFPSGTKQWAWPARGAEAGFKCFL